MRTPLLLLKLAALIWLLVPASASAFYNSQTGRFLNRDPIGERGGQNLSSFVANGPVFRLDALGLEEQGPQDFSRICQMAKRLRADIDRLPSNDLRRLFLDTQNCILNRLCNSHCCLTSDSSRWLNNTVTDFMNPLLAALEGSANSKWSETFAILAQWQTDLYSHGTNIMQHPGSSLPWVIGDADLWWTRNRAAQEMALTHINEDLAYALSVNGIGFQADWDCVGKQVAGCEREKFNWLERLGAWTLGWFWPEFDVSLVRDDMRDRVWQQLLQNCSDCDLVPWPSEIHVRERVY